MPQALAGFRSEPPMSLPSPIGAHAAGQRWRLAAARAAGGATGMPGISCQTVQRTVGVHAQLHIGQIGAGDR